MLPSDTIGVVKFSLNPDIHIIQEYHFKSIVKVADYEYVVTFTIDNPKAEVDSFDPWDQMEIISYMPVTVKLKKHPKDPWSFNPTTLVIQ